MKEVRCLTTKAHKTQRNNVIYGFQTKLFNVMGQGLKEIMNPFIIFSKAISHCSIPPLGIEPQHAGMLSNYPIAKNKA